MTTSTRTRLQWISTVVRVALAVIMLWAASIDDLVAVVLPIVEATVGILLLLGLGTRLAAWVTAGLMIVFIAGVASAWIRGLSIDCGCFGGGGDVPSAGRTLRYILEILRDTGFLLMAAWLVGFPASRMALDRLPGDIAVRIDEDVTDPDTTNENA
jgi:uncharacterized membrane protein YphA (DoxX/SURF4 family)